MDLEGCSHRTCLSPFGRDHVYQSCGRGIHYRVVDLLVVRRRGTFMGCVCCLESRDQIEKHSRYSRSIRNHSLRHSVLHRRGLWFVHTGDEFQYLRRHFVATLYRHDHCFREMDESSHFGRPRITRPTGWLQTLAD